MPLALPSRAQLGLLSDEEDEGSTDEDDRLREEMKVRSSEHDNYDLT